MATKKYKATDDYKNLGPDKNFQSMHSASTHEILKGGGEITWDATKNGTLPKAITDTLTEIKEQ